MIDFRSLPMHEVFQFHSNAVHSVLDYSQSMRMATINENPKLGAYTDVFRDEWLPQISNKIGSGFTAAIKANIAGNGWPTHCGSRLLAQYSSSYDSTVVQRLRSEGFGFSGITTMDEFGMGSTCEHTTIGRVVNPWNTNYSAGGSSGGSAAAVASGLAWFALGSDTGGSVRLPAHFCGVVGFKPTYGRISRFGLVAFASSLDTIGIIARDVRDAHFVYKSVAGMDPLDSTSLADSVNSANLRISNNLEHLQIGVPDEVDDLDLDIEVRKNYQNSLHRLESLGASLIPVSLANIFKSVPVYMVLNCAEAASNLHRFDGTLYGDSQPGPTYLDSVAATRNNGFGPEVKRRLLLGAHVLSAGYRDQYYLKACASRQLMVDNFNAVFARVDVLAMPTCPTTAMVLGKFNRDPVRMHTTDTLTVPASLAGLPAVSLPTGIDSGGLPHSLQLIGNRCADRRLLECASVLETDLEFRLTKEAPWMVAP